MSLLSLATAMLKSYPRDAFVTGGRTQNPSAGRAEEGSTA
jgi:NADH dehydrogenase